MGTGAKPFLFFTILAVTNPGDEIIYPDPGFPIYESAIRFAGANSDAGADRAAQWRTNSPSTSRSCGGRSSDLVRSS